MGAARASLSRQCALLLPPMSYFQTGILAPVPAAARYITFGLRPGEDPTPSLRALSKLGIDENIVVGIGASTTAALGKKIPGLRTFPEHAGVGVEVPSTPGALWASLRGEDRGELLHRGRELEAMLIEAFEVRQIIDGFRYRDSRDLTGFEDGTENPTGTKAIAAAFDENGASFVAVQQWQHDLDFFLSLEPNEQNDIIGRKKDTNEEFDAPASAHVKRTAQESFDPEAFILRRSMPWVEASRQGLIFVAYGKSFDAFEAQLSRMTGEEDGVVDGLFRFSRPLTGAYYYCPPARDGTLDLSALLDT